MKHGGLQAGRWAWDGRGLSVDWGQRVSQTLPAPAPSHPSQCSKLCMSRNTLGVRRGEDGFFCLLCPSGGAPGAVHQGVKKTGPATVKKQSFPGFATQPPPSFPSCLSGV